jgi:L-gulonate 5-dehydrogenase
MHLQVLGVHVDGALVERLAVRSSAVHVANGVTAELAALVEPLSIGVQASRRARIADGERVVVFGAGAIGHAVMLAALQRGARVLVVDQVTSRLNLALTLGAENVVDANQLSVFDEVGEWTGGDGADVVVEATGSPTVLRQCISVAAHGARVLVLGTPNKEAPFSVLEITRKELDILGSRNNVNCFPEALQIVRSMPEHLEHLITQRFELSEVENALHFANAHPELTEKIMITVS